MISEMEMVENAKAFINGLKIPMSGIGESLGAEQKPEAKLDDAILTSFVDGLIQQTQEDVLNSVLLAQLAADYKYSSKKDPENWYSEYTRVLPHLGWVTQGFKFDEYHSTGQNVEIDRVVINVLAAIVSADELALITATMKALDNLPGDAKAKKIWDSTTHDESHGTFQNCSVSQSDKVAIMKTGAFYFSAKKVDSRFLWVKWGSDEIKIFKSAQVMNLNLNFYATIRQTVIDKLGDRAKNFIADIPI
jgi:hypothetical protein